MGSVAVEESVSVGAGGGRVEEESVTAMGERMTAELRAELHRTELQLSHWVAEREQRLGDLHAEFEESMEARANDVLEIRKGEEETRAQAQHYAAVARQQEDQLQEEVKRLEELHVAEREELPAKLEVLGVEHDRVAQQLEAKKKEMANRRYLKNEELSALGRGVLFYSRLGLDFEGGESSNDGSMKCLRLVFRQISRTDPDRPFVIAVRIDEAGRYAVPECFPMLPKNDFEQMLADVNESNDFAAFVSRVRRGFVTLADAGL